jgi:hypothetical protein
MASEIITESEFTVFMLVKTQSEWLKLTPRERFIFLGKVIKPLLEKYSDVKMRFFDAEAYSAEITDIIMWQTKNISSYHALIEGLRETDFWDRYFLIKNILPSFENAFQNHYKDLSEELFSV